MGSEATDLVISKIDELTIKIDCPPSIGYELKDKFSFDLPHFVKSRYRNSPWSGRISLYDPKTRKMNSGLLFSVIKFCSEFGYSYSFNDKSDFALVNFEHEISEFKSRLGTITKFSLEGKYDYQWKIFEQCLKMNKLLVLSPTSCLDENTDIEIEVDGQIGVIKLVDLESLLENRIFPKVDSPTGFVTITDVYRKYGYGVHIVFADGSFIRCADEHLIHDGEDWIFAKNLFPGYSFDYCDKTVKSISRIPAQSWIDFSVDAPHQSYRHNGLIHHNSGKSSIIYLLVRFLLEYTSENILIVVPTISLTSQMVGDFSEYVNDDFKVNNNVSILYGGQELRETRVLVSTWQSLVNLDPDYLSEKFAGGAVIVDESHLATGESISSIIKAIPTAKFRFGFTGTLSEAKANEMVLRGLFGPVYQPVTTSELIKRNVVSDIEIRVKVLSYSREERELFSQFTSYGEEVKWIAAHDKRCDYIVSLALSQKKNCLILFNFTKHGEELFRRLTSESGKKVFLITGSTPPEERERIRAFTEENEDVIIVASSMLFSTGVSIKNLHSVIFAHSFKAKIRNLQSIGRTLRLHKSKEKAIIFDISDDLSIDGSINTAMRHLIDRLRIYKREGFTYSSEQIKLFS